MRVESYLLVYLFRRAKFGTDPSSLTRPLCFRPYQQNKRARKSVQFSSLRSSVWVIQEYVARLVLRWSQSETNKTQLAYRRRSSSSLYKCLLSYKRRICLKSFLELVDPPPPGPLWRQYDGCFRVEVHVTESSSRVAASWGSGDRIK